MALQAQLGQNQQQEQHQQQFAMLSEVSQPCLPACLPACLQGPLLFNRAYSGILIKLPIPP